MLFELSGLCNFLLRHRQAILEIKLRQLARLEEVQIKNEQMHEKMKELIGKFIESGFIDSFRYFNENPHNYTWWSQRANSRAKNLGWRIDYFFVTPKILSKVKKADIMDTITGSDHCPILLEIK